MDILGFPFKSFTNNATVNTVMPAPLYMPLVPIIVFPHGGTGEGNGIPLQCSCLENPRDRGAWWAAVHGVAQSWTRLKQLSMHAFLGEGNGNPLQYSCLEDPRDRGAWWTAIHGVARSRTRLMQLSSSSSSSSMVALVAKNLPVNAGDIRDSGSIPESERFPGEGNGNPLQYSCLENPMDRGASKAIVRGVTRGQT